MIKIVAKGIKSILLIGLICLQFGCAQKKLIKRNEMLIYGEALKGNRYLYDPTVYTEPGMLSFINTFFPENSKRDKFSIWIAENNWSFIYRKMERTKGKNTKLSTKKILDAVDKHPLFAVQKQNAVYSPILMNDEMTKALLIFAYPYNGSALFFEFKDNRWVVIKSFDWIE